MLVPVTSDWLPAPDDVIDATAMVIVVYLQKAWNHMLHSVWLL